MGSSFRIGIEIWRDFFLSINESKLVFENIPYKMSKIWFFFNFLVKDPISIIVNIQPTPTGQHSIQRAKTTYWF